MKTTKQEREKLFAEAVDFLIDFITDFSLDDLAFCPEPSADPWDNEWSTEFTQGKNSSGKPQLYFRVEIQLAVPDKLAEALHARALALGVPVEGLPEPSTDPAILPPIEKAIEHLSFLKMWLDGSRLITPAPAQLLDACSHRRPNTMVM